MQSHLDSRLDLLRETNQFPPGLIERLGKWIASAPEEKLYRINVLRWAKDVGADENLVIDLFLHATNAGIVDMVWSMLCTQCGMLINSAGGLRAMSKGKRHCRLCRVDLQASLDDEIEVDFCISPAVRRIRFHNPDSIKLREDLSVLFVTPSINDNDFHRWMRDSFLADGAIGPKETLVLEFDARRGYHDVFAPQVHALSYLVAREQGSSEVSLELFDGQMLPEQIDVKIGPVRAVVHNNTDLKLSLGVSFLGDDSDEHPAPNWRIEPFLSGKRVLTSQTFRNLFKAETIEVGTGMELKSLTVLFTDLQASTAMYERVGDMNALGIVRRHFEVLEAAVAKHLGAVVKTIGDAVMAVFAEPERAMAAAAEMIETVRRAVSHGEDLVLKIGLHQGPCVAIQSNNQVDYFGRTVNIAARVQALAEGGQIVCSVEVWDAPGVQRIIEERGLSSRRETASLKGIAARFPVRRILVASAVERALSRSGAKKRKTAEGPTRKPAPKRKNAG